MLLDGMCEVFGDIKMCGMWKTFWFWVGFYLFAFRLYFQRTVPVYYIKIRSPGLPSFGKSPRPPPFSGPMNLNSFSCIYFDKMDWDLFLSIYLFWAILFTLQTAVVLITESDDLVFILLLIFLRSLSLHSWEVFYVNWSSVFYFIYCYLSFVNSCIVSNRLYMVVKPVWS